MSTFLFVFFFYQKVLQNFPVGLQADISLHLNREILSKNPVFEGCTPGCLRSLALKLRITHCPPGDYIIHYGDEIINLYWINRGTVEVLQNDSITAILGSYSIKFLPCLLYTSPSPRDS